MISHEAKVCRRSCQVNCILGDLECGVERVLDVFDGDDRLLILNDQHLERVLDVFVDHYNGHRPHRALALTPPRPTRPAAVPATEWGGARVQRRDRLGGVVHEYVLAA